MQVKGYRLENLDSEDESTYHVNDFCHVYNDDIRDTDRLMGLMCFGRLFECYRWIKNNPKQKVN